MSAGILITIILVSLGLGALSVPLLIRFSHRHNILDMPGKHKRHKQPTPFLGGVALFLAVWLTVGISYLLFYGLFETLNHSIIYIFFGSLMILLVGLSDDFSPLSAWVKLAAQAAAGVLLYLAGLKIVFLTIPFSGTMIGIGALSVIVTILWVIVLTNAINLIDGLDGLASGVSLIAAVTLLVVGQLYQVGAVLVFVLVLIGFLSLFLYYNRYPARIFLGDSGSMQIGFYFAVFSLAIPLKSYTATALYVPVVALGVPLMEVLSSAIRRSVQGQNIMRADRRHLFHYLSLMGFSRRKVIIIFYVLAMIYGLFAVAMFFLNRMIVFGLLVFFMVVIFGAFFILLSKFSERLKPNGRRE